MQKILVLFAHPAFQKSRANRALIEAIRDLEAVTVRDLYELYPDLHIDTKAERTLLVASDVIVMQHPFYWYSAPAMLKEWQDLVLEHGWAYGHGGNALQGKKMLSVVTTGGGEAAYRREGYNRYTVRELLAPFDQTAHLCGMEYLPPFVVHGTLHLDDDARANHARDYRRVLMALRDGCLHYDAAKTHARLNQDLGTVLEARP